MITIYYILSALGITLLTTFIIKEVIFYKRFLPVRKHAWISISATVIINIIIVWANRYFMPSARIYLSVTFLFILLGFLLIFKTNFYSVLYISGHCVFFLFVFRAVILALFSLILNINIQSVIVNNSYYPWVFCISLISVLLYLKIIRSRFVHDENMQQLFSNKNQFLTFISIFQLFFNSFLLVIHHSYAYSPAAGWFSFAHLMASIFTFFVLQLTLYYTVKVNKLMEYEIHTHQLQEQLQRQLQHYKSYQKYTESFRAFKHDYKKMMAVVASLACNDKNCKAGKLLKDIYDNMQKEVLIHQNYSNNLLLDAILQDTANQCEENNIRFSAVAYLPDNIVLSDIDVCRVFSNLMHNAIEACIKTSHTEPFIDIKSNKDNGWITMEITNSFDGKVFIKNGKLETTKSNKEMHGLGIKAIKDIIEGLGGIVKIEINDNKAIFSVRLYIPNPE